jgi:DamX protein
VRQQPGAYFTVQLFATTSREKRDAFVNQQEHPDRFATFETRRNGEAWYAVTYGAYPTQADAKSAAAALPGSVGKVQPWIRTFASLQATIE